LRDQSSRKRHQSGLKQLRRTHRLCVLTYIEISVRTRKRHVPPRVNRVGFWVSLVCATK
jgi:hypothetical protein